MSTIVSSHSRPYISRRKRRLFSDDGLLLGNRSLLVFLGLLVVGLLVSLGIIAAYFINFDSVAALSYQDSAMPAKVIIGLLTLAGVTGSARP